jgi:AbrB family looped-hinge helix DNA binding protein
LTDTDEEYGKELFRIYPRNHSGLYDRKPTIIATLRISSKGRITIPKQVRDRFGLQAGDQLLYVRQEDGTWVVEKAE